MQGVLNESGQLIIKAAIPLIESQFVSDPSRLTGDLVKSLRSQATRTSGKVKEGLPSTSPYAGWWEFGGPRAKSNRPPNRKFIKEGRGLYPAYQEVKDEINTMVFVGLGKVADIIVNFKRGGP